MLSIKKISFAVVLSALAFAQSASAATTLYSQSVSAGTSINSQEAIGGSDRDVFIFAAFTATQTGTVDNISWQGTANPATGFTGFSDGFTIDVLDNGVALPGSVAYAPISNTFLASTGLANPVLNANGMYDYNAPVQPFYVQAGKTYHLSIRANGIAPWGWATGPGTGTTAYVAGVYRFLPSPGIPVFALNNVNNTVVAPPLVNPTTVTIVPVPTPTPTTVVGATGDVQGMVTGIGNGYFTTDTVIGGIHGAILTYDGDTVTTYHGGLVTYAVGEMVNYSYTVDTNGVMLAKTVDVYPTELVNGVGRVAGYTTTNGVLNGNGLGLTSGEVLTGTGVPYINFNYASSYNLIMTYTGFRNPTTGFVYVTSAQTSALPITVKPVLPAGSVGQMFSQNPLDFSLFGSPVNFGGITATGLPAGLVVSGGSITGIPQVAGTYTVTITAYANSVALGSGTTTIVVSPADPNVPVVVATPVTFVSTLANAQATVFYPATNLVATGMAPLTVTATGVPVGMTVSSAGVLSGYAAMGTYTIALSATSAQGVVGTGSVTLTVGPAPVIPVAATLANGKVGVAYTAAYIVSASYLPLFMISSVTGVPAGMTVSAAGVLSGTPRTAGTYQIGFSAIGTGLRSLGNATATLVVDPPADTVAPVITMNGANVILAAGTSYVDAGATCTDNVDPTCTVTTTSTVNTAVVGTYTVTYSAKDFAGNIATPVVRTVTFNPAPDTVAPVITMNGSNVTLIAGTSYVDAGATCTDNIDAICIVAITNTVDTTTAGTYTVTYTATDLAGNVATPVVRTVTVTPVSTDTTAPVITMNGSNVTLIVGNAYVDAGAICMDNVDPTCTVTTTSTVNTAVVGTYTVTYTATDLAGNVATPVVRTVTVNPVSVVTISGAGTVSSIGRDFLVINGGLNASDHVFYTLTPAGTTFLGGVITFATGEYVTFTGTVDGLGAIHATSMSVYPAVTYVNVLANAQATVAYPATNLMVSGTAPFTVMATGVPAGMTVDASGVLSGTPTTVGVYPMTLAATDSVGNIGRRILNITVDVAPDTTAPVITMNGSNVTLIVGNAYVDAGAICMDNVDPTCTVTTTSTVNTAVVGTYTVTYGATDLAGNIATPVVRTVTVNPVPDTTAPVITMNGSNVTLIAGTSYVDAGATCTDNVDPTCTVTTTSTVNTAVVGTYTVTYGATDLAGNIATPVVRTVTVNPVPDTTAPVITMNGSNVTLIAGTSYVDAGATCTDNVDPTCTVTTTSTVNTAVVGTYTVTYGATDLAGNIATPVVRTVTVNPVPVTPVTFITTLANAQVKNAYTSTNLLATGVSPFTVTATGVPAGMKVSSTGNLSGTPTTAGTYTITLSAKDAKGTVGTATLTLVVNPVTPVTFITTLANAQVKNAYTSTNLLATGVSPFTVTATGVPAGMKVSSTGNLSGTPTTAGTYTITLSAKDAKGTVGTATLTLVVNPVTPVTFITTLANAQVKNAYTSTNLLATGVSPFTVTATGVPAGMKVSSTGNLSGTPKTAGTYTITLSAKDAKGTVGTATLTLVVN